MEQRLDRLLYVSRSTVPGASPEIGEIARVALERNSLCGVTGYLYYDNDTFMQVLEGMPEDVTALYSSIEADARHREIRLLSRENVSNRIFGHWAMGFYDGSKGGLIAETFGPNLVRDARPQDAFELIRFLRDLSVGRQDVYVLAPREEI